MECELYCQIGTSPLLSRVTMLQGANVQVGSRYFFLSGPGGTGKTHLINMLLAYFRSRHEVAIAVASSGVASLLLDGGTTAHARFKMGFPANEATRCR